MYKLVDLQSETNHEMNEAQIKDYLKSELEIDDVEELEIEEIAEILHSQGYQLERV